MGTPHIQQYFNSRKGKDTKIKMVGELRERLCTTQRVKVLEPLNLCLFIYLYSK